MRNRLPDLAPIANGYLQFFARQCGKRLQAFTAEASRALRQYPWPGNLRELRNAVERAVILAGGEAIDRADLPEKLSQPLASMPASTVQVGAQVSLEELVNEHIALVVQRTHTMEEAARVLGIDPATLYRKRKRLAALLPAGVQSLAGGQNSKACREQVESCCG